jgi:hypothetical protein
MKRFPFAVLPLLLMLLFTHAGATAASDNARTHQKGVNLSGEVSNDGKTLLADDENHWAVSNADALKGLEGRYVTVRCRMNLNNRTIQVLSIVDEPGRKHARMDDAAFRR